MSGNYTIDDSLWNTSALSLSPGWNMLNSTSSYFISELEVGIIRPLLETFHDASYSWNTHAGCSNTLTFIGTSISVYGLAGPDSGEYSLQLDGSGEVRSAFAEETDYAKVLFMVSGLEEGVNHTLTMTNLEDGKWFGFDCAQVSSPPAPSPGSQTTKSPEASVPSPSPSSPSESSTNFTLPAGLIAPLQFLSAGQPTPEQVTLINTPYNTHWTTGAYFVVFVAGVSIACLYVFFLFQFAGMLREQAGGAPPPTPGKDINGKSPVLPLHIATPRARAMANRFSWGSGASAGAGVGTLTSGHGKTRPSSKVMMALKLKKISGPSPIPEEVEMKVASLDSESEASGSGEGMGKRESREVKRDSHGGTWPRRPGSFPRLSFGPNSPKSPRDESRKGYF